MMDERLHYPSLTTDGAITDTFVRNCGKKSEAICQNQVQLDSLPRIWVASELREEEARASERAGLPKNHSRKQWATFSVKQTLMTTVTQWHPSAEDERTRV